MGFLGYIRRDYRAVFERDPAAKNGLEVILAYPGFHAIFWHRINHMLWKLGIPVIPRLLSHIARFLTGIEIHPAAKIGPGFFIDHGMGVVIGETAEVGENCLLYQGVTLGGTGKEKGKRHPTLRNNVVVGAGAKILGAITIGNNVIIGANSVILKPVPDNSICVGVPGRITRKKIVRMTTEEGMVEVMDYFPDPVVEKQKELESRIDELTKRLDAVERTRERGGRMRIYNTLTGKKEEFFPVAEGKVGMYACGVTVYDHCHIGHARSAVVFDVMRRYMIYKGYQFKYIRNFTDIDDKIINRAKQEGISWDAVARKYTEEYYRDMDRLGVGRADVEPKATEHMVEIIGIVKGLMDRGFAYAVDEDVYFEVSKFNGYGKLSKRDLDDMMAGARVEVDERKNNPMDFALWKASKEGEPAWESPWGPGRPGWHIECSAMSRKYLGDTFDIHGGGKDLVFPHHENEIAQSEGATGKPFARYWLHNGFVNVNNEKMSKSLGNFFTLRDVLAKVKPEVLRFFLAASHYRSPIDYSDQSLTEAKAGLDRLYRVKEKADACRSAGASPSSVPDGEEFDPLRNAPVRFGEAMDDDFNAAAALGHLFGAGRVLNRLTPAEPSAEREKAGQFLSGYAILVPLFEVLGLLRMSAEEYFQADYIHIGDAVTIKLSSGSEHDHVPAIRL